MAEKNYTGKNSLTYLLTLLKQHITSVLPTKVSQLENDSKYVNETKLTEELGKKQDTLTAGSNIRIEGNIISATGEILNSVDFANITGDVKTNLALNSEFEKKADEEDLTTHTGNQEVHVTSSDKQTWNSKTTIQEVEAKGYQTKQQVDQAIADAVTLSGKEYKKVDSLPGTGEARYIYLVTTASPEEQNGYDEYIWITEDSKYEYLGTTKMDLSGYVLSSDLVEIDNEEVQQIWDSVMGA